MTKQSDLKNLILAMALSFLIMAGWQHFVEKPRQQQAQLAEKIHAQSEGLNKPEETQTPKSRQELLTESPRVSIHSTDVQGSLNLKGLRFDDLSLAQYRETLDPKSPEVILLSPAPAQDGYFAEIGWLSDNKNIKLPSEDTVWTADHPELTPTQPVTLSWNNGSGVTFYAKISLDEKYLFTIECSATDATGNPIALSNYAFINRVYDIKVHPTSGIMHEGPLGVFDGKLHEATYKTLIDNKEESYESKNGWLGIADKYWLAAFVPEQKEFTSKLSYYSAKDRPHFQVDYRGSVQAHTTLHFFAGAKEMAVLDDYASRYHIPLFDHAVDLGWFDFLTKPILKMLTYFYNLTGNFGIAILILTVLVKLFMFPLASKSFRSMNQMKLLQPKINEIRERHKDDSLKMNQAMMELYKREKVNPASGCLPMFIQIPVFFSLYKVLYVALEMRHAPFFGWIHDLSAPDPTNLFTLFGLIPWEPPALLHLGIWPIIMCLTMVIQQRQSPPPADPTQAKMMKLLPLVMLFLFSSFASGLVIYWSWSNLLTILQQWYIKVKHEHPHPHRK
ncbi:MAG TPA: membrane protein insertase YidC [Rickettsiales bacterium]|nr:membrane protein insertase YidC [Rickettsiales bacterium]